MFLRWQDWVGVVTACFRRVPWAATVALALVAASPAGAQPTVPGSGAVDSIEAYRLGPGDVISIRVYGEDDLTKEKIRLTESGTIAYPFGDVIARGRTVGQLEQAVADGLRGRFLVNPRVSVTIEEYRPFFIYGQVGMPGRYPYQPGLNVRKAVSMAGGFKDRASLSKMFVVREGDKTNTPRKVDLNSPIGPGDTVTVEESFF